jgi:hypothetical protein
LDDDFFAVDFFEPPDRLEVDLLDDDFFAVDFFELPERFEVEERFAVDFFAVDFFEEEPPLEERFDVDFLRPPLEFLPPRLEAPGEFAIFAARSFDMPSSRNPSYCLRFLMLPPRPSGTGITSACAIPLRRGYTRDHAWVRALLRRLLEVRQG